MSTPRYLNRRDLCSCANLVRFEPECPQAPCSARRDEASDSCSEVENARLGRDSHILLQDLQRSTRITPNRVFHNPFLSLRILNPSPVFPAIFQQQRTQLGLGNRNAAVVQIVRHFRDSAEKFAENCSFVLPVRNSSDAAVRLRKGTAVSLRNARNIAGLTNVANHTQTVRKSPEILDPSATISTFSNEFSKSRKLCGRKRQVSCSESIGKMAGTLNISMPPGLSTR